MNVAPHLSIGYSPPFALELPNGVGFSRAGGVEIAIEVDRPDRFTVQRLETLLSVFHGLAATGALAGKSIEPSRSGLKYAGIALRGERRFVVSFSHVAVDDAAVVVLVNLLVGIRRRVAVASVRVLAELASGTRSVVQTDEFPATYPEAFAPIPFVIEDEQPETDALMFDIEFEAPLAPPALVALNARFDVWATALRGDAYSVGIPSGGSHVESYVDGFIGIGRRAERAFHKLRAADGAIDAALNVLVAFHHHVARISALRLA